MKNKSTKQKTNTKKQNKKKGSGLGKASFKGSTSKKEIAPLKKTAKSKHISGSSKQLSETELLRLLTKIKNREFNSALPEKEKGTKGAIFRVLNEILALREKRSSPVGSPNDLENEVALKKANEELKGRALLLSAQKSETESKNKIIEEARRSLEEKANQLMLISKYKSEFLANMSHELRTPLNSLQILAHELIENPEGNLSDKQIHFIKTIKICGQELIDLINDILDLSKIESGYISLDLSKVNFNELTDYIDTAFRHISTFKKLNFTIETEEGLPEFIETDSQRLNQILKNLLSNSFKFTESGSVSLKIFRPASFPNKLPSRSTNSDGLIAFEIKDSGIGIAAEKQHIIFEAFQQEEGSTSRKYGGTGLGLSISQGLANLLGGVIELESIQGAGSKFTLYLPLKMVEDVETKQKEFRKKTILTGYTKPSSPEVYQSSFVSHYFENKFSDDRQSLSPNDKVILIVGNDTSVINAKIERSREFGLKVIATQNKNEVIDLVLEFKPQSILMQVEAEDIHYETLFNRIKNDFTIRHIPIYVTTNDALRSNVLSLGAKDVFADSTNDAHIRNILTTITNYNNKEVKNLLVLNDNEAELSTIVNALSSSDVKITGSTNAEESLLLLKKAEFDCVVYDPAFFTSRGVDQQSEIENAAMQYPLASVRYAEKNTLENSVLFPDTFVLKSDRSLSTLVNQVCLYLHRYHENLPPKMRELIKGSFLSDQVLVGKKVLIVDDDMRNLFVLTNALERYGFILSNAESGREALMKLEKNKEIDIVLMDMMMPEMDGYDTMKEIRKIKNNETLPIIALTARAMKGDRQKCISSGASDYITKPIMVEQLLDLMRLWLKKEVSLA
jgi:signal transduction histidine kinase/CheY-like chemotaxis protein